MPTTLPISGFQVTGNWAKMEILQLWGRSNARFEFRDRKLLYTRIFANIALKEVVFLKFIVAPITPILPLFQVEQHLPVLRTWQHC